MIRLKGFRLIFLLAFTNMSFELTAQEISYYDQNWNLTTVSKANYYFVTIENYPKYRMNTLVKYRKKIEKHEKRISNKILREIGTKELKEINFQASEYDSIYLGRLVKVFSAGEIYDYLCKTSNDSIDWPSNMIKEKTGVCNKKFIELKEGAIGIIVWEFHHFKSSHNKTVFLLQIDDYYIPIDGSALTLCDKYSNNEIPEKKERFFHRHLFKKKKLIGQI
jgi:hypothetical protein